MTWDKPITADGCTATPEQIQAAWDRWIANGDLTASRLEANVHRAGVPIRQWHRSRTLFPSTRVADRMLQNARKAGAIRFVKGRWEVVAP